MKAQDFALLERALSRSSRGIVGRILSQPREQGPLAPWEERFLEQRIFTLGFPELASWLAHRPRDPKLVIEAIVALAPRPDSLASWHLIQHAPAIGGDSWQLLQDRLRPLLSLPSFSDALSLLESPSEIAAPAADSQAGSPLGWLAQHGVPRGELVALALEGFVAPDVTEATLAELIRWLGERLVTRSAWESHGEAILYRFYVRWGWDLLGPLFQLLHFAIERSRALATDDKLTDLAHGLWSLGASPPWVPALHESLARVLIRIARELLERGHTGRAKATLAALSHLSPPSRVVPQVHRLLDLPDLAGELRELIELNVQLLRRENGKVASLEAILNALRELPPG
jgi:hypothetical protein